MRSRFQFFFSLVGNILSHAVDQNAVVSGNYVPASCRGCHIAHFDADWLLEVQVSFVFFLACAGLLRNEKPFNPAEFGLKPKEKVPDISIDPESRMLTVINQKSCVRCFYITLGNEVEGASSCLYCGFCKFVTNEGEEGPLEMGEARDEEGNINKCATFIILVQPRYVVDVCYVNLPPGGSLVSCIFPKFFPVQRKSKIPIFFFQLELVDVFFFSCT